MNRYGRLLVSLGTLALLACAGCQASDDAFEERAPDDHAAAAEGSKMPGPIKVGEEVAVTYRSPAVPAPEGTEAQLVWSQELSVAGASYIAPHFAAFSLPEGAHLVVRAADGSRERTYTGKGKDIPGSQGFWGMHMPGDSAIIELYSQVAVPEGAVVIDRFARGTDAFSQLLEGYESDAVGDKAICGSDESDWAQCFTSTEPTAYDKSRAVARLIINGSSACTGWLVGSEGHLLTNEHCLGSSSDALNTDYEFMAEGSCTTECTTFGGCPGTVEADTATLVQLDAGLDYALVKLPVNLTSTYGFFQMRSDGAVLDERIYIPQHAAAWGKRIAFKDGTQDAVVTTLTASPCSGTGNDVGYMADTQGGSSGSPVVAYGDNLVIALHHCANCPNRGVPVEPIIADLGSNLPADAVSGGCEPRPSADAGADQTICLGESATVGTAALADHGYLWAPNGETTAQITVAPTATTTYTVEATTSCGSVTDSATVFVDDGTSPGLSESFDGTLQGWSTSGLWHRVNDSTCASPGYVSPLGAMYYGQDASCDYSTGSGTAGDLISPVVSGITADSVLRFNYFRQVESYSGSFDKTTVFVSADGGATWTQVFFLDSSTASENAWTPSGDISLAAFAGASVQVRFNFDSGDSVSNTFVGWMVDDVEVTGQSSCGDGGGGTDPANTAPQATITAPADGASVTQNTTIDFTGSASDTEDGDLSASLSWSSDLDGALGTGSAVAATLSRGTHVVTASVTDSAGATSTTSISVQVTKNGGGPNK